MLNDLLAAKVDDRVRFEEEKQAYTIQARGYRYLVLTKPFNARRTVLYTVVDLQEEVRGTENLIFGGGAETREQCQEMLMRLEGRADWHYGGATEVSHRNRIPLKVRCVLAANKS